MTPSNLAHMSLTLDLLSGLVRLPVDYALHAGDSRALDTIGGLRRLN